MSGIPEQAPNRLVGDVREAQVPVGQLLEVDLALVPQGLVQAQIVKERGLELQRAVLAAQTGYGIAGQGAEQQEVDRDGHEHGEQREQSCASPHSRLVLPLVPLSFLAPPGAFVYFW